MITVHLVVMGWLAQAGVVGARPGLGSGRLRQERTAAPGATIRDLLAQLAAEQPEFARLVYRPDTGRLTDEVHLVVDDRLLELTPLQLETPLAPGMTLQIITAMGGGGP